MRLVKAGADVVGISFEFDPFRAIRGVKKMMEALNKADLKVTILVGSKFKARTL